jgi:hypothetical protein
MVGNTVLVTVWLSVGVLGLVVGLLWLRGVERARRSSSSAASASRRAASATVTEVHEPDALAG